MFKEDVLKPLEESTEKELAWLRDRIATDQRIVAYYEVEIARIKEELAAGLPLHEQLPLIKELEEAEYRRKVFSDQIAVNRSLEATHMRNLAREQERLLRLQKAQQNLRFLQQQLDLLETIKEHGLDAREILGGLRLGIGADTGLLLDAMAGAMEALVDKAEEELGIGSPSRVFEQIGERIMGGLAMGIQEMANLPAMGVDLAVRQMINAPALAAPNVIVQPVVTSGPQVNVEAGGNTITSGMDEALFEIKVTNAVRRALAGERR
jgi:hypothetical protein